MVSGVTWGSIISIALHASWFAWPHISRQSSWRSGLVSSLFLPCLGCVDLHELLGKKSVCWDVYSTSVCTRPMDNLYQQLLLELRVCKLCSLKLKMRGMQQARGNVAPISCPYYVSGSFHTLPSQAKLTKSEARHCILCAADVGCREMPGCSVELRYRWFRKLLTRQSWKSVSLGISPTDSVAKASQHQSPLELLVGLATRSIDQESE